MQRSTPSTVRPLKFARSVLRATFLVVAVIALAACGGDETAAPEASRGDGVQELANVLDLRAAFEADAGKPRLLVLFSPT